MQKQSNLNEEQELLIKTLDILGGADVNIAISVLTRLLESMIIGAADDKSSAIDYVEKLSKHLREHISVKDDDLFGYLGKDDVEQIIFDQVGKGSKH